MLLSASIFFLAYSSQLPVDHFQLVKSTIIDNLLKNPLQYTQFANLRIDNDQYNETIYYHTTIGQFSDSIDQNLPDNRLATENATSTNVYGFLEEFSKDPNLYGSTIFLLMKLLPEAGEEWTLVTERLKENKVEVLLIITDDYGGNPLPLIDLVTRTNGIITWVHEIEGSADSAMNQVASFFMDAPLSDQLVFSSSHDNYFGNLTSYETGNFTTSVLDHTLAISTEFYSITNFMSMTVYFTNQATNETKVFGYDRSDRMSNSDLIYKKIQLESGAQYSVSYDYLTKWFGANQIRIYF